VTARRPISLLLAAVVALALLAGAPGTPGGSPSAAAAVPTSSGAPLAAGSPFGGGSDSASSDDSPRSADGAPDGDAGAGRPDRLTRIASELRSTPFVVDPELDWMIDRPAHRAVERTLRGARIPIFVAVLPSVDEDESGGDLERVVQRLQRDVARDGLYVAVDQDARMDLASVGVPLDLGIPFSVLFPPRDERPYEEQERDPAPPPGSTIPGRLQQIVAAVAEAGPGTPNGVIDDVDELSPLPGEARDERHREDAIAGVVMGVLLGLLLGGVALGVAGIARAVRSDGGPGGPSGAARGGRRSGSASRGGAGSAARGRRRRRGGRRA
jgi:hypothetical protein